MDEEVKTAEQRCCLVCRHYEPRSQFCRRNPPIPVAVPDKYGSHMMSAFPKIPCPNFDYCSFFEDINAAQLLAD